METKLEPDFHIGRHKVWRIEEWAGKFSYPEGLFAEYEAEAFQAVEADLTPDYLREGQIYAFLQSWLIEADGLNILVDTGAGNEKHRPNIPVFGQLDTDFLERFERSGKKVEDIDLVICTHLHIDHVGWNTRLVDGNWVPTFPNARYLFPAIDRIAWDPSGPQYASMRGKDVNANVFEDSVQPILDAGIAELVEDEFQPAPGMVLRNAPGHTPGHMVLEVRSGGERALFTGDILHHPMQVVRPDWNSVYCEDRAAAARTRLDIIKDAASDGARIVPAHFGGSHTIFVEKTNNGYKSIAG